MERKFIVDFMLGRLCRWLRLLGENAGYFSGDDKGGIIYRSLKERRIILTRDTSLSRKKALDICLIESDDFRKQLKQVIEKYDIFLNDRRIYTRCILCNNLLKPISKDKVRGKVPQYVFDTQKNFSACSNCFKIYWKGTHRELIEKVLGEIK